MLGISEGLNALDLIFDSRTEIKRVLEKYFSNLSSIYQIELKFVSLPVEIERKLGFFADLYLHIYQYYKNVPNIEIINQIIAIETCNLILELEEYILKHHPSDDRLYQLKNYLIPTIFDLLGNKAHVFFEILTEHTISLELNQDETSSFHSESSLEDQIEKYHLRSTGLFRVCLKWAFDAAEVDNLSNPELNNLAETLSLYFHLTQIQQKFSRFYNSPVEKIQAVMYNNGDLLTKITFDNLSKEGHLIEFFAEYIGNFDEFIVQGQLAILKQYGLPGIEQLIETTSLNLKEEVADTSLEDVFEEIINRMQP